MKRVLRNIFIVLFIFGITRSQTTVNFTIDVTKPLTPISPYIYGTNNELSGTEQWKAFRLGGNRMTGYNWENNASNAGSDWQYSSDNYMLSALNVPSNRYNEPAVVSSVFHERAKANGAYSLATIQLAGYVAKDMNGTVTVAQTAPSPRWAMVHPVKGSSFSLTPSLSDTNVYIDEYINYNVKKFGTAAEGGINGYCLDNEPALWPSTHIRIHPTQPTCQEIVQRGIEYAGAVKNVDSTAEIFGPVLYGFAAYTDFQGATDWSTVKSGKSYQWFIDYYLDEMKKEETTSGRRLLDVLDLHWYPEAKGDNRIVNSNANTHNDKVARVQAPRTLWDAKYIENSWIGQWGKSFLPLIPKLKASIGTYYPGTKLSFSEFDYGGAGDITGGIAISDVLGIFGKYGVYSAFLWPEADAASYYTAAYKMFTDYDGNSSTFGKKYAYSATSDSVNTSVYGSVSDGKDEIHLIVINKDLTNSITGNFSIVSLTSIESGTTWLLDGNSSSITPGTDISDIQNNSFSYTLPAASVSHIVLHTVPMFVTDKSALPQSFALSAYPNPFNPSCHIDYVVERNGEAEMDIYDVTGRLVKSFAQLRGSGSVIWEGMNDKHQCVSSGVYIVMLKGNSQKFLTQKIVLMK